MEFSRQRLMVRAWWMGFLQHENLTSTLLSTWAAGSRRDHPLVPCFLSASSTDACCRPCYWTRGTTGPTKGGRIYHEIKSNVMFTVEQTKLFTVNCKTWYYWSLLYLVTIHINKLCVVIVFRKDLQRWICYWTERDIWDECIPEQRNVKTVR